MNNLFNDLTQGNLKIKNRSCQKCGKYFGTKERVDCINLNGTEVSYCLKHYDIEIKKLK